MKGTVPGLLLVLASAVFSCPGPVSGQDVSREELQELLAAFSATVKDVEFVYEGTKTVLALPDLERIPLTNRGPGLFGPEHALAFQGRFAWAGNRLTHLDLYTWKARDLSEASRGVTCFPGTGKRVRRAFKPEGDPSGPDRVDVAWIGDYLEEYQPLNLLLLLLLETLLKQKDGYSCQGWETIDGHPCLVVRLDTPGGRSREVFWVDLNRGGHPLRRDYFEGEDRIRRIDDVRLERVALPGGAETWFPVRSTYRNYRHFVTTLDTPVVETTYGVVTSTLLINQGLPRSRFQVDYRPGATPVAWTKARSDARRPRIDAPESPVAKLEKQRAKADELSVELEAPEVEPGGWLSAILRPPVLIGLGISVILVAVFLRRRV